MTAGPSGAALAEALVRALRETLAALESSDLAAAASASDRVNEACAAIGAAGASMPPDELALARDLQARCEALAHQTQSTVVAALLQSSVHRRASDAYGSTI